jgi:hypothetical protein
MSSGNGKIYILSGKTRKKQTIGIINQQHFDRKLETK